MLYIKLVSETSVVNSVCLGIPLAEMPFNVKIWKPTYLAYVILFM